MNVTGVFHILLVRGHLALLFRNHHYNSYITHITFPKPQNFGKVALFKHHKDNYLRKSKARSNEKS